MRVKLNRGPAKGKVQDFDGAGRTIIWQESLPINFSMYMNPMEPVPTRRGTYERSNVVQKNGTVVYEWRGWLNESL
jgi:hypothetical protein